LLLIGLFLSACSAPASAGEGLVQTVQPTAFGAQARLTDQAPGARLSPTASSTRARPVDAETPTSIRPRSSASPTPGPPVARRTATPTQANCLAQGGRIETGSLETKLLRLPLVFRIYTPPCYELAGNKRYPVLYLFHGQSYTDDQWDRMGVDETADRLIADGEMPPILIVMPYDRYGGQPTETDFSQAITEVLIPYIDRRYRTVPDRAHRAVGGLSRGAGWAVHFGISEWKLFGALGAHSVAVFHTDAQRMRTWLGQIPPDQYPRIYMDIGDKDRPEIMRSALWFEGLLNQYDIPHEWHLFSGYHSEEYWKAHLEQYLRWYTQGWWTEDVKLQYSFMLDPYNDAIKQGVLPYKCP
jgi:enterochelin esterase-like enzyme